MRKLLFAVLLLTLGLAGMAHAVCDPRTTTCLTALDVAGDTTITGTLVLGAAVSPYARTLAQINALSARYTYQSVVCTDCVRSGICISTSTAPGGWVIGVATGTFVGAGLSGFSHCQ